MQQRPNEPEGEAKKKKEEDKSMNQITKLAAFSFEKETDWTDSTSKPSTRLLSDRIRRLLLLYALERLVQLGVT